MGVTVHYRGRISQTRLIETFEDRIIELALDVGGMARIWRSCPEDHPERIVKGTTLELAEGLETVSFILSPEGVLLPLYEIERAENGPLDEMPWVLCKTQFGTVNAHVTLVELLKAMKAKLFPNLEVLDEGKYFETGDLRELCRARSVVEQKIKTVAKSLKTAKNMSEPGANPNLQRHIVEIAQRVHRTVLRPPEHPAVEFKESDTGKLDERRAGTEEEWDAMYRENERKQSSLMRNMEERLAKGGDPSEAFDAAMRDEGIIDLPDPDGPGEEVEEKSEWADIMNEAAEEALKDLEQSNEDDESEMHPLLARAAGLLDEVMELPRKRRKSVESGYLDGMIRGLAELNGAMSQVFTSEPEDDTPYGLLLVQLKRALRGAAFFRGSLAPMQAEGLISRKRFKKWSDIVVEIEQELQKELFETRRKLRGSSI